jgi:hypothetical protein
LWLAWLLWAAGWNVVGAILASVLTPPVLPLVRFQAGETSISLESDGLPTLRIPVALRRPTGTADAPVAPHAVTVELAVEKPAEVGVHCRPLLPDGETPWTVTIPADRSNAEAEIALLPRALDDGLNEIVLSLVAAESYALGKPQQHILRLPHRPPPALPVLQFAKEQTEVERPAAGAPEARVKVELLARPPLQKPLSVEISVGGDAQPGRDYTLPGGSADGLLALSFSPDQALEVPLTVQPGAGLGRATKVVLTLRKKNDYDAGTYGVHTIALTEKIPPPVVVEFARDSQSPVDRPTAANQKQEVSLKVRAAPAPTGPLQIPLVFSGDAVPGQDFTVAGRPESRLEVALSAGTPERTLVLEILPEKAKDAPSVKTIVATLQSGTGYELGKVVRHTIPLKTPPSAPPPRSIVTLKASDSVVTKGGSVEFTARISPVADAKLELRAQLVVAGSPPLPLINWEISPRSPDGKWSLKLPADLASGTQQVVVEFSGPDTVDIQPNHFALAIQEPPLKGDVLLLLVATEAIKTAEMQAAQRDILQTAYKSEHGPLLIGHDPGGNHGVYVLDRARARETAYATGTRDPNYLPIRWEFAKPLPIPDNKFWPVRHSLTDLQNAVFDATLAVTDIAENKQFKTILLWPSGVAPTELNTAETGPDASLRPLRDLGPKPDQRRFFFVWLDQEDRTIEAEEPFNDRAWIRRPGQVMAVLTDLIKF